MCDVRNMNYVTKLSNGFVCHPLFKSHSCHRTEIYDNVKASCYVEIWSANAVCLVSPSGWGVTIQIIYCT